MSEEEPQQTERIPSEDTTTEDHSMNKEGLEKENNQLKVKFEEVKLLLNLKTANLQEEIDNLKSYKSQIKKNKSKVNHLKRNSNRNSHVIQRLISICGEDLSKCIEKNWLINNC